DIRRRSGPFRAPGAWTGRSLPLAGNSRAEFRDARGAGRRRASLDPHGPIGQGHGADAPRHADTGSALGSRAALGFASFTPGTRPQSLRNGPTANGRKTGRRLVSRLWWLERGDAGTDRTELERGAGDDHAEPTRSGECPRFG